MDITREDIRKEIARLRALIRKDPRRYGALKLLLSDPPDEDYDPTRLSQAQGRLGVPKVIIGPTSPELPVVELAAQKASRSTKLEALEARRAAFADEMAGHTEAMKEGTISVQDWLGRFMEELKGLHISAYAAGKAGKWNEMTFSDYGRVGQILRTQYDYARRWAAEIALHGVDAFSIAQLKARAKLYAAAAQQTFEQAMMAEIGLDPSIFPAWPGQGTLCKANCRCRWSVRIINKSRGDYDARWLMGRAEHCRVCRERQRKWHLKIRRGALVTPVEPINS